MMRWHVKVNHTNLPHNTQYLTYNKIVELALKNSGFTTVWVGWLGSNTLLVHHEKSSAMTLFLLANDLNITVTEVEYV